MRIGITGACGFIGTYLRRQLALKHSGPIRLLVREGLGVAPVSPETEVMAGDLDQPAVCEKFLDGLDVVYHLAHKNSPINSDSDPYGDARNNLPPTLNLIHAAGKSGRKVHIVYFSSGGAMYQVVGDRRVPFRECEAACPTSSYGILKLAAENYLRLAAERGESTATVLRVGNAFGTALPAGRLQGLIGVAVSAALAGKPVNVFGSMSNVRDYIHLHDVCSLAWLARIPRQPFTVVNVGSGVGHSVAEVLEMIRRIHGSLEIKTLPGMGGTLPEWVVLDIVKAKREFGWEPEIGLHSGIEALFGSHSSSEGVSETLAQRASPAGGRDREWLGPFAPPQCDGRVR